MLDAVAVTIDALTTLASCGKEHRYAATHINHSPTARQSDMVFVQPAHELLILNAHMGVIRCLFRNCDVKAVSKSDWKRSSAYSFKIIYVFCIFNAIWNYIMYWVNGNIKGNFPYIVFIYLRSWPNKCKFKFKHRYTCGRNVFPEFVQQRLLLKLIKQQNEEKPQA